MLPKLSVLLLSGHFDNTRFVYNSGASAALLDDTYDPGLIALLLLYVLAIGGRLFSRQTYQ